MARFALIKRAAIDPNIKATHRLKTAIECTELESYQPIYSVLEGRVEVRGISDAAWRPCFAEAFQPLGLYEGLEELPSYAPFNFNKSIHTHSTTSEIATMS